LKYLSILFVIFCNPLFGQPADFTKEFQTQQIIIVTATDKNSTQGALSLYEADANRQWKMVMKDVPIMLGRNGMAWGSGLHPATLNTGELKREGDGKSPAGIYRLNSLFSYGQLESSMPHTQVDSTWYCVDDVNSDYYNRVVTINEVSKDWNSAEDMKRKDHQYKFGVVVAYNTEPVRKSAGSCIFLHIWKSPGETTSGCTSMTEANLLMLIHSLDKTKNPTLVQMPLNEYNQLKKLYKLP
jgi:L,D-peptidoglycan transpeptidase YkuD (ErfK/YbiS/YcfS/YnhG family)